MTDPHTWITTGEIAVTALLVVRMLVVGFLQPPGRVLSWPMFTRGCYIEFVFEVSSADSGPRRIDALDLVPSYSPAFTPAELQLMADWLSQRYEHVAGEGVMRYAGGTATLRVVAGHVVR